MALLCAAMSTRREKLSDPRSYLTSRGKWPDGPFMEEAPEELEFYVGIVKRLRKRCDEQKHRQENESVADIASRARLSPATLYNILEGRSWGELRTIYRLEKTLNAPLWHHEHL